MFLPPEYLWAEPVIIAALVVFIIDLIGNSIAFGSKVLNALVTAIIFGGVFGALVFYGYGDIKMSASMTPAANAPANTMGGSNSGSESMSGGDSMSGTESGGGETGGSETGQ